DRCTGEMTMGNCSNVADFDGYLVAGLNDDAGAHFASGHRATIYDLGGDNLAIDSCRCPVLDRDFSLIDEFGRDGAAARDKEATADRAIVHDPGGYVPGA